MIYKSEFYEKFREFRNEVEKLGISIKSLRCDPSGKYLSQEFLGYLLDNKTLSKWTPPYTLQHNGVVKRTNRTLLDLVKSMIGKEDLHKSF